MSSLKFCRGAKEEDDSQSTDNTEMGRPNVLRSALPIATKGTEECVRKNGLTGKILCFNLLIIEKKQKRTLSDVCGSFGALDLWSNFLTFGKVQTSLTLPLLNRNFVLSAMASSLRASSYAQPIPLITSLSLLQTSKRKKSENREQKKNSFLYCRGTSCLRPKVKNSENESRVKPVDSPAGLLYSCVIRGNVFCRCR